MNYVKPSIQARLNAPATSKADRVGFWYWRGKMRLGKGQVREVSRRRTSDCYPDVHHEYTDRREMI